MNDLELKQLWRQQVLAPPVTTSDLEMAGRMKKKLRKFDRTIFWRDVRELAACAIVFFGYWLNYVRQPYPVARAGCVVFMLSAVFIGWRILQARHGGKRFRHPASTREFLHGELDKVSRQIRLLETVVWWYLLPLFIGWELYQWGSPGTVRDKIVMTIGSILVCAILHWVNCLAARKSLLPLKEQLEATLRSMPEFSDPAAESTSPPKSKWLKFMNWLMCALLLIVLISLVAPRLHAGKNPPDAKDIAAMLRERVEVAKQSPGMVVGIVDEKGAQIFSEGRFEGDGGRAVDGDTIFEIGSITKVFTSLALADMVERGEVKLDDPISKYLPASVKVPSRQGREITLADLATHTSGLPRLPDNLTPADGKNPYADYSVAQLYEFLGGYTLTRDAGADYEYSNLGGGLLGHVLALRAGTNYESLVRGRICAPLGMTNTGITLTTEWRARLAPGHDQLGRPAANWDLPTLAGAGALRSTANDLLKFAAANLGLEKSGLQPAMELTQTPRHAAGAMRIGLGWHIANKYDHELVWHNGGTGGYRSFIGLDKQNKRAVVVLANSANDVDDLGFHLLEGKYELAKTRPGAGHVAMELDAKVLDGYTGRYQLTGTVFINVRRAGDHLQVQMTGQSYLDLFAASEAEFFLTDVDAQISFKPAMEGKPATLVLHQNGLDQTAKKISSAVPGQKERVAIALEPKVFDAYVGEYELQPGAVLTMQRRGGRYFTKLTGQDFLEIFPESETGFFLKAVDAQLGFEKDAKGVVTGWFCIRTAGIKRGGR